MTNTREELETIATDLVQRDGLGSFSFRTLADHVGIKSASVHHHFPTKLDLAAALIEEYSGRFRDALATIGAERVGLKTKLERLVSIFDAVRSEDKLCLCGALAAEAGALDDVSRQLLERYFLDTEGWIESLLHTHHLEVRALLPPAQLARVLMSGLEGALLLDRAEGGSQRLAAMRDLVRAVTH